MTHDHPHIPAAQRRRLLLFNLRTDADDHILGFTTRWINGLADYYEAVDVLTTHAGRIDVADNVRVFSVGREQGYGRARRLWRFYTILGGLLLRQRYDACFAHMQPLFAVLAAPLLTLRGVRCTTWYTHKERTRMVQGAARLSYRVVSAVQSSFPVPTPRLRALGHGIDTHFFTPPDAPSDTARIVQVARLTAIKHQHVLLAAAQDVPCEIVFVGDVPDGYDDAYKRRLQAEVVERGMQDRVHFAGAQTPDQVREWYRGAALAVNLSPPGLFDKAALEGMACGLPVVVSNEAFAPLTAAYRDALHIPAPDDSESLRERLRHLLRLSPQQRQRIGSALRQQVIEQHSFRQLLRKLITVMHRGELPSLENGNVW